MMEETKRKRLEAQGWRVGTVQEFLDLAPAEVTLFVLRGTGSTPQEGLQPQQ